MNIYVCDCGVLFLKSDISHDAPETFYEDQRVIELVIAHTRGQARSIITSEFSLDFTSNQVKIRIVSKGLPEEAPCVIGMETRNRSWMPRNRRHQQYERESWGIVWDRNLLREPELAQGTIRPG